MIQKTTFNPLTTIQSTQNSAMKDKTPAEMTQTFGDFLQNALNSVQNQEKNVQVVTDKYMVGQADISQVMIASSQAELSLQLTSQVRNKVVEAYQEIMRMQM
ncbi:flagellar hook-basal body complex protein FliE [Paenibacillus methanolicus]|uniref:Flagellar hook-basal body complex protein FliE n=1 Tax=Paenibacillus methanolicus TaxID=582686 RepID=A0A5S5CEV3_9BACL|nr:flagellar hook-basal body complex protein FliE [Paenibacillus methanolicus]TYP77659.1 flagellar hook-basal body complex protein FliE [Paenibacillus methanolicus]